MTGHPQPGDFGLTTIGGFLGWLVNIGQAITRDGSRYTHAFVVLDNEEIIEAMPGGARIEPLSKYLDGNVIFSARDLTDQQRADIVRHARSFEGVKYSFRDYYSLALLHWGIRPDWVVRRVKNSGHMICSQLVDEAYLRAGVHLFDDGRYSGDVTPGDLLYTMLLTRFARPARLVHRA